MATGSEVAGGWMLTGFFYVVATWCWAVVMLLHALWRSTARPEQDVIRPAGPIQGR